MGIAVIIFAPTKKIKERFKGIDFVALAAVYSTIIHYFTKKYYVIKILHSKLEYSYYEKSKGDIKIYIGGDTRTIADFHSTMLHEFRHFIQDFVFDIPWTKEHYDDSTTEAYNNSLSEIDANNFDKQLYYKVVSMYKETKKLLKQLNGSKYEITNGCTN